MSTLGIIAGGGELPRAIADSVRASGRRVFVAAVDDAADGWVDSFDHDRSSMGQVGRTLGLLHAHGCKDVVFAGYVRRPNFFKLRYDWKGITWFPSVLWGMRSGDNTLLDVMVGLFEKEGFAMKSVADVAPDLQIEEGPLGNIAPSPADEKDIATAIALARAQGRHDVGQAIVVRAARVLAVEGRDGTDAMLQRLGALPPGRGVLAKALKPIQNRKSDLPTIGVATVKNAAAAGLAGIAIEAHTALVLGKAAVIEAADALGLFVVGVPGTAMTLPAPRPLTLMLIAGEPSGDQLGGQLMAALKSVCGDGVEIIGMGGPAMTAQGLKSFFPLSDTAVMGLREVVPKIPVILRRVNDISMIAITRRPDAVVLIDSPDFNHRIAARLKRLAPGIPLINYVAPQVWASRQYRASKMARNFDLLLALLPFEPPFFEKYGLHTVFVGHPVIERARRMTGGPELRARLGIAPGAPLLCVLPGSRTSEIRFILPVFRDAVGQIARRVPNLVTILPTVPHVAARVREATTDWPSPLHIVEDEADKYAAFKAANAALAASGTVTVELALARTPMVVAYKVGGLTYALAQVLFRFKYFALVNLLLDRMAVPELLQHNATPAALADAVTPLLTDPAAAAKQIADLNEVAHALGEDGESPSLRAAHAIVDFVKARTQK